MVEQGKVIAVLGGDRRMAEAVRFFRQAGVAVRLAALPGCERLSGVTICDSGTEALHGAHVAVLPVQGVGEGCKVFTQPGVPGCAITVDGLLRLRPGATLFSGVGCRELTDICREVGVPLVEYREADEFAIWNSIPSAEGAIQMAMAATPFTLFGSRSLVLGFGRTGKAIALLLRGLYSDVTVAVQGELDCARVWASGYRAAVWERLAEAVAESQVIFNTVPARVLTREVLQRAPEHATVIDVASAPGGTDFEAARALGITAELAPGLPGIVAPVSAGKIISDLILRHLDSQERRSGGNE